MRSVKCEVQRDDPTLRWNPGLGQISEEESRVDSRVLEPPDDILSLSGSLRGTSPKVSLSVCILFMLMFYHTYVQLLPHKPS